MGAGVVLTCSLPVESCHLTDTPHPPPSNSTMDLFMPDPPPPTSISSLHIAFARVLDQGPEVCSFGVLIRPLDETAAL
jgi:hypothetical protein